MTARPIALAPSTAPVELCQGCGGSSSYSSTSSRSGRATATDGITTTCGNAGLAELWDHLGGEEFHVVEIGHVQKLQVDPLHAGLGERTQLVDDLVRSAHHG